MREHYDLSYADLAARYSISKSEAYYLCNPIAEKRKNINNAAKSKRYYNKEKRKIEKKALRAKKKKISSLFNI